MAHDDLRGIDFGDRPTSGEAHDATFAHGVFIVGDARGGAGILPLGPGWFDSSFELERGLQVRESDATDAAFDAWCARFAAGSRRAG